MGGTPLDAHGQTSPPDNGPFTAISSGYYHTCAIRTDGTPFCWGIDVSSAPDGEFTAISSGDYQTCGLRQGGLLGPKGLGRTMGTSRPSAVPRTRAPFVETARWSVGGMVHPHLNLQLRRWTTGSSLSKLAPIKHVVSVTMALSPVGIYPTTIQQIRRPWEDSSLSVQVETISAGFVMAVPSSVGETRIPRGTSAKCPHLPARSSLPSAVGGYHTCALRHDGTPVCWGNDGSGRSSPPGEEQLLAISTGNSNTCGLREDGSPICWGDDTHAQSSPPEGERFIAISSGSTQTCAIRHDRSVACWGWSDFGQTSPPE